MQRARVVKIKNIQEKQSFDLRWGRGDYDCSDDEAMVERERIQGGTASLEKLRKLIAKKYGSVMDWPDKYIATVARKIIEARGYCPCAPNVDLGPRVEFVQTIWKSIELKLKNYARLAETKPQVIVIYGLASGNAAGEEFSIAYAKTFYLTNEIMMTIATLSDCHGHNYLYYHESVPKLTEDWLGRHKVHHNLIVCILGGVLSTPVLANFIHAYFGFY
jgi:hypothetical protein